MNAKTELIFKIYIKFYIREHLVVILKVNVCFDQSDSSLP